MAICVALYMLYLHVFKNIFTKKLTKPITVLRFYSNLTRQEKVFGDSLRYSASKEFKKLNKKIF